VGEEKMIEPEEHVTDPMRRRRNPKNHDDVRMTGRLGGFEKVPDVRELEMRLLVDRSEAYGMDCIAHFKVFIY
jgi:hypothetical protein